MWTEQKFVLGGIFSGLGVLIQTALSFTVTQAFGAAASTPVLFFVWPFLMVLFRQIINEDGSISLMGVVGGILTVPTPAYGPPGFVPKLLPIVVGSFSMDIAFAFLRRRPSLASVLSGSIAVIVSIPLFAEMFLLFGIPGAERVLTFMYLLIPFGAVEAALGGFLGHRVYERIKGRPSVLRMHGS